MAKLFTLFICLLLTQSVESKPLEGYISNHNAQLNIKYAQLNTKLVQLKRQCAIIDKRGKRIKGHVKQTTLKGLIGILYTPDGRLVYIYPESDLNKFDIHAGDYIIKVEKEAFRPCLLPYISLYPVGYILNLTIRRSDGSIKTVPVKLLDARKFSSGS